METETKIREGPKWILGALLGPPNPRARTFWHAVALPIMFVTVGTIAGMWIREKIDGYTDNGGAIEASSANKPSDIVPLAGIKANNTVDSMRVGQTAYVGAIWLDDERHAYLNTDEPTSEDRFGYAVKVTRRSDGFHVTIRAPQAWAKISGRAQEVRVVDVRVEK
jgi:hypothetical protein